jgi:hypothetical protein
MINQSKYTAELLHFLENEENYPEMIEWIEELPELDQPNILREIEAIFKDRYEKTGEQDWLDKANFIAIGIDDFEEDILDQKLDKALFMMQFDNVEIDNEKVIPFLIQARKDIIKKFLTNPTNKKALKKAALELIKMEKQAGYYNPSNWEKMFS